MLTYDTGVSRPFKEMSHTLQCIDLTLEDV